MNEDKFPIHGTGNEQASWMFQDSIMESRVKRRIEDINWQIAIRTTALQCAAQVATNLPLQNAYDVLDKAKQFEKYLKGE